MDLTKRRPAGKWIVDFGTEMSDTEAALYEEPFAGCQRNTSNRCGNGTVAQPDSRYWWRHAMDRGLQCGRRFDGQSRYVATAARRQAPAFRLVRRYAYARYSSRIVIARDDDTTFGILHSRFHEVWSLRLRHQPGRPSALHA